MNNTVKQQADNVSEQVEQLRAQIAALTDQFSGFVNTKADRVARAATRFAGAAGDKLDSYGFNTDAMLSDARTNLDALQRAVAKEARSNPLRTVAIAAGIGLILGALSRRG